jgi:hypothetical protein
MSLVHQRFALSVFVLFIGCAQSPNTPGEPGAFQRRDQLEPELMSGQLSDVEWANQFFMTQIHDARWNPDGMNNDTESNNCGPASLAMLLTSRGWLPADLNAEVAIDHARAMMAPSYPELDASRHMEDAHIYADQALVCVDDDTHPVFFDEVANAGSIPQGIEHGGGKPVFGYSWDALDSQLEREGAVIAYGHITKSWRNRFEGEYGTVNDGAIPHFIGVFRATADGDVIVCDPMHKGGAVVMSRGELQTFFTSPVNVYDTTIRIVSWTDPDTDSSGWTGTVSPAKWEHYGPIDLDAGTLVVTMTGTGDADLYVRDGAKASESDWDCRPLAGTSNETCRLQGPGRYHVGVRGYDTPLSAYNISTRIETSASTTDDALEPFEVATEEWLHFAPIDIDEKSTLVLTMTGTGDTDLYARQGAEPSREKWDCRPYASVSEEQCRLEGPGTWHFAVRGYAAPSSMVTLTATAQKRTLDMSNE